MKKYFIGFLVLVALAVIARVAGNYIGTSTAVSSIHSDASQQQMPTGFFGVKWLTPTAELRSIRPNVVPDAGGMLAERVTYLGREAKIDYYVKTGNVLMFIIHFAGPATKAKFASTNEALNRDYGPLSTPKNETDEFGSKYCSSRQTERFEIDHCIRTQSQGLFELITVYRRKPA